MTDPGQASASRVVRGIQELDGDALVGLVLNASYTFDPDHEIADILPYEQAVDRLEATGAPARNADEWVLFFTDLTTTTALASRGGVYWITSEVEDDDAKTVGWAADPGGVEDPYEPTWDDGFVALPIRSIDAQLNPYPSTALRYRIPRVKSDGTGYELRTLAQMGVDLAPFFTGFSEVAAHGIVGDGAYDTDPGATFVALDSTGTPTATVDREDHIGERMAVWEGDNAGRVYEVTATGAWTLIAQLYAGQRVGIPVTATRSNVLLMGKNVTNDTKAAATGFGWVNDPAVGTPGRYVAFASGIHVGVDDPNFTSQQDNVDYFAEDDPDGTVSDGSQYDGLPYFRIAAHDEQAITLTTTNGDDEVTAAPGSFTGLEVGDRIYGVTGIADGTTIDALADPDDGPVTLSANASASGTDSGTVRWPAIGGERIGYDAESVVRLTGQQDEDHEGTFELFADLHGVTGLFIVRTIEWNGLHVDGTATEVRANTPFLIVSGEGEGWWQATGDGMSSSSRPIALVNGGGGSGDVVGPASVTANRVALFDGTTGKLIKQASGGYSAADIGADPAGSAAAAQAASQPLDSDLTTVAGLSPSNDDVLQRKGGAWTNRTLAQIRDDLMPLMYGSGLVPITAPSSGASGTWIASTSGNDQHLTQSGTPANTDYIEWAYVPLAAGTYSFGVHHIQNTDGGQMQLSIDGSNVGSTVENYAGTSTAARNNFGTGITVATSGFHTIRVSVPSKNGSSSGYRARINSIGYLRTA